MFKKKRKYRIIYMAGDNLYYAQVRKRRKWKYLTWSGESTYFCNVTGCEDKEGALERILKHANVHTLIETYEF